jgi:hypothetical protein
MSGTSAKLTGVLSEVLLKELSRDETVKVVAGLAHKLGAAGSDSPATAQLLAELITSCPLVCASPALLRSL